LRPNLRQIRQTGPVYRAIHSPWKPRRSGSERQPGRPGLVTEPPGWGQSLNAPLLWWTAPIVGNRCHVDDGADAQSCRLQRSDGCLPARARALDVDVDGPKPVFHRLLRCVLGGLACGKRSALPRSLEPDHARAAPGEHVAVGISDGDQGVVERRLDVRVPPRNLLALTPPRACAPPSVRQPAPSEPSTFSPTRADARPPSVEARAACARLSGCAVRERAARGDAAARDSTRSPSIA